MQVSSCATSPLLSLFAPSAGQAALNKVGSNAIKFVKIGDRICLSNPVVLGCCNIKRSYPPPPPQEVRFPQLLELCCPLPFTITPRARTAGGAVSVQVWNFTAALARGGGGGGGGRSQSSQKCQGVVGDRRAPGGRGQGGWGATNPIACAHAQVRPWGTQRQASIGGMVSALPKKESHPRVVEMALKEVAHG